MGYAENHGQTQDEIAGYRILFLCHRIKAGFPGLPGNGAAHLPLHPSHPPRTQSIVRKAFLMQLVHVHSTSTSLKQHYKLLTLFLLLFFFDYQVLKFSGVKMLGNVES
jgi:hypothetical protein